MRWIRLVGLLGFLSAVPVHGEQPPAPAASKTSDDGKHLQHAAQEEGSREASAVIEQLCDFYKRTKTFRVELSQQTTNKIEHTQITHTSRAVMAVERPNRFAIRTHNDLFDNLDIDVICDGRQLTTRIMEEYTQSAAPGSFDEFTSNSPFGESPLRKSNFFFRKDPYAELMHGVTGLEYLGREKVADLEAHHLKIEEGRSAWELWVAAENEPRVLQTRFDWTPPVPEERPLRNGAVVRTKTTIIDRYTNWQFDVPLGDDAFAFVPPADARKVDNLFDDDEDDPLFAGGGRNSRLDEGRRQNSRVRYRR